MAGDEQNLRLGVEYDGSQGVSQFLSALAPLPEQVTDLFGRMGAQLQGTNAWDLQGKKIAASMYNGLQAALAGFPQMAGAKFGETVLAGAGLTPAQVRSQRELVSQLNGMRDQFQRQGVPAATQRNFSQTEVMGLQQVEGAVARAARAYDDLAARRGRAQQQLDQMRNITTNPQGTLDPALQFTQGSAKAGTQWTEAATLVSRTAGFQLPAVPTTSTGMPSEAAARKLIQDELNRSISTMTRSVSAMDQQMRVYNAAPAPRVEQVRQAVSTVVTGSATATPPTELQQRLIEARAQGVSQRDAAVDTGVSRYQVQKVDELYASEIASMRASIAAREAETAAIRAASSAHVRGNVGSSAMDRVGPTTGRSSFDFEPNEYLPSRDPDTGELMPNRSGAGSRYVYDRKAYEEWWRQQPALPAELDDAYAINKKRGEILASSAKLRADTAAGKGVSQPPLTNTVRRLVGDNPRNLAWEVIERPIDRPAPRLLDGSSLPSTQFAPAEIEAERQRRAALPLSSGPLTREALTEAFGGPVSWKDQLKSGFGAGADSSKPFMEMVGQTARISLFYGTAYRALTLLQTALSAVTQETLAYEGSLTDLSIATGRSRADNQSLSTTLSNTAAAAGFNPSQGIEAGWKSLGLYGVASASQAEQERVAKLSTEVSSRVARVSGGDPVAINTQLAGALRSFQYGIDRLPQLEDMITYVSRNTGQSPTELLGATSNIATLGKSAGFTPEQLMAIVAQVGTTTGQNPESTAGQFRQVLSREFGAVADSAKSVFGIDSSKMSTVEQLFEAVSKVPRTQAQENAFTASFGKGGSQSVALITLQNWDRIQNLASGATSNPGAGQAAFDRVMDNIGSKIKEFGSEMVNLGVNLIETGVVDWIGLLVEGGVQLARELSGVLNLFNEIPRPLRSVALALTEIVLASKFISAAGLGGKFGAAGIAIDALATKLGRVSVGQAVGTVASGARSLPGVVRSALSGPLVLGAGEASALRVAALGAAGPTLTPLGRLSAGARGLTGLTGAGLGVAGLAIGAGALAGDAISNQYQANGLVDSLRTQSASARTAESLREAASAARNTASELRKMSSPEVGDVAGLLPALIAKVTMGGDIKEAGALASISDDRARRLEEAQKAAEAARPAAVFTDFSADGLSATLSDLEKRGYSASQRLAMLNEALFSFSDSASRAGAGVKAVAALDQNQFGFFAAQVGDAGIGAIQQARQGAGIQADALMYQRRSGAGALLLGNYLPPTALTPGTGQERSFRADQAALNLPDADATAINDAVTNQIQLGLQKWAADGVITPDEAKAMVSSGQGALQHALGEERWAALDDATKQMLTDALSAQMRGIFAAFSNQATPENLSQYLGVLPQLATLRGQEAQQAGASGVDSAQIVLTTLLSKSRALAAGRDAGKPMSADDTALLGMVDRAILAARKAVADAKVAEIQSILNYRQSSLSQSDVMGRLRLESQALNSQLSEQTPTAPSAWSNDSLLSTRPTATRPLSDAQRDTLAKLNANAQGQAAEQAAIAQGEAQAAVSPGDSIGQAAVALAITKRGLSSLTEYSSAWWAAQVQVNQQQFALTQVQTQGVNANALSRIDPRNTVARLDQQIANARRERSAYAAGDPQAGSLDDQINQLGIQRAEAIVSRANAQANASIAGKGSSLLQAQVAVANAQRSLAAQLSGSEGYYSALASLRETQAQLGEQERSQADRIRRLNSDLTDPVEQARLDVQAAMAKAAADRASGSGPDVQAQDQIDVKSSQNQQEAAAFNQRISDLQTAEDLGRISHTAYMSYLQSEHDRLAAVADRTRQQQEELDQVDKLMKAAAEQLNGQFNLGDIKLPTIYEVRRSIASGSPNQVSDYSNSNNVVTINGANFDQVVAWLTAYMGSNAQIVRAAPRRV